LIVELLLLTLTQSRPEPDWLPVLDAPKNLTHELRLPKPAHAGEPLSLSGRVLRGKRDRTPVAGVVLYFHQTDARGIYPRPPGAQPKDFAYWHGTLRGWLRTDRQGRYSLRTTRPGAYPNGSEPAHIHVYGLMPKGRQGFYLSDFVFEGDPLLTDRYWEMVRRNRLDVYGGVRLQKVNGVWRGTRDLFLSD
jgi:protocatechuate 3,4-dioxygenase, beta subunit